MQNNQNQDIKINNKNYNFEIQKTYFQKDITEFD